MNTNDGQTAGFRGASRAQGYIENVDDARPDEPAENQVLTPRDIPQVVPQMGDNATNAEVPTSEQLLARFQGGGEEPATEPAPPADGAPEGVEAVEAETLPEVTPSFELRVTRRDKAAETPSLGWRRRWRQLGFKIGPSAEELAAAELGSARSLIRLSRWLRSVGILVANPKGGVGKTPLSLAIAGCMAMIRGGGAIVLEVADDPGALSVRAEGRAGVGVAELLRDMDEIRGAGHLDGYVSKQTSYAGVIGTVGDRDPLTADDVRRLAAKVDEFNTVRVMDTGNQPSSSAFHGALEVTDVLVIPVLDALDALQGAMQLLRHLHQLGGHAADLARNAIVVRMHDGRPEDAEVSAYAAELIETAGIRAVYHVPFDRHIAERSTLAYGQLAPATTTAITQLTAGIVTQLNNVLRKAD